MRIGDLHRKALKKLLVNCVEKPLLLGEVADSRGCPFDCEVETIQATEKIITAKRLLCECLDDGFDLAGDDVAVGEIGVAKDGSENPLGQQMLDQHLLNGGFGEIGIDRLTAFRMKILKRGGKVGVDIPFILDQGCQAASECRHFVFELCNRLLPFGVFLRTVGKEGFENPYQLHWVIQIDIKRLLTVLPKDGALRGLEKDVVAGVACCKLPLDLDWQVVVDILRFPITVRQLEIIDQRTINDNPPVSMDGYRMLRHQGQVKLPCTVFKQRLKCRSDSGLVRNAKPVKLLDCGVVGFDRFVGGFEIK